MQGFQHHILTLIHFVIFPQKGGLDLRVWAYWGFDYKVFQPERLETGAEGEILVNFRLFWENLFAELQ